MWEYIFSAPVILAVAPILYVVLRRNVNRWNLALRQFQQTKDHRRFREQLVPLSQQKLNLVVRMKAQVNLTWIHSHLGESQEAKDMCLQVIKKNKNLIGTTMAYAVLVQELILEENWDEAMAQWKDAMEIGDADGNKAPEDSFKLHLYGYILRKEYAEGLQMLEDAPRSREHWVQETEAGRFWTWYLQHASGMDDAAARARLEELPVTHQGYLRVLNKDAK